MLKTNKEIETKFKESLEETLDEYFPKIEEETPEKIVNKRGEALMLFTKALLLFREISHQTRIADLEEMERMVKSMEKFSSTGAPHCRNCDWIMIKATGMGKIVFPYQCPNCNNYQEETDEKTGIYNQAISDILFHIQKVKEEITK